MYVYKYKCNAAVDLLDIMDTPILLNDTIAGQCYNLLTAL